MLFGIALTAMMLYEWSFDNKFVPIYCFVVAIWVTVFTEQWKRRQSEIAHTWDMKSFIRSDAERAEYKSEVTVDPNTAQIVKKSYQSAYTKRIFVEGPTIVFALAVVVAGFIGFRIWKTLVTEMTWELAIAAANSVSITVFNMIYKQVALLLCNWENHRYEERWEASLITKNFSFQFVNSYISLFGTAFADRSLT